MYEIDFSVLIKAIPFILKGIEITVFISVISSFFAFIIGVFVVFLRTFAKPSIKVLVTCWVELTRNIPLLVQLFFLYKALPSLGIGFSGITCGIIALSCYTGAYISEVLRSGINSIANEQFEASFSLCLSKIQTFRLIILPQALSITIPPLRSQFISLVKNSSLVSFIAVTDIFYVIYKGAADDFRVYEYFFLGIVIYMSLTGMVLIFSKIIEKSFKINQRVSGL
ncbi:MAG: amino acid ABC transporter permease [Candidatus Gastranaerophilaceae bacterium]|jgi:His/Glu/Gln/Arg/opine family amino acid ABC transporter permease subunit